MSSRRYIRYFEGIHLAVDVDVDVDVIVCCLVRGRYSTMAN